MEHSQLDNNESNTNSGNGNIVDNEMEEELQKIKNLELTEVYRKKLISDIIVDVFNFDLEKEQFQLPIFEISEERQELIQRLAAQVSQLSNLERLLLYLKLPSTSRTPFDPLRQPLNPLGNRQEIQQTIVWIKTHLEEDQDISIPKQDVYDQYLKFCSNTSMKPLSTADFGKVMKQVYPGVRPRRLGTRGNSRYCYAGMRNTCKLSPPSLPSLALPKSTTGIRDSNESDSKERDSKIKGKKSEKPKRKWRSSVRSKSAAGKCTTLPPSRLEKKGIVKSTKRTRDENGKVEEEIKTNLQSGACASESESHQEEQNVNKSETSDQSFNAFESLEQEFQLNNGIGIYLPEQSDIFLHVGESRELEDLNIMKQSKRLPDTYKNPVPIETSGHKRPKVDTPSEFHSFELNLRQHNLPSKQTNFSKLQRRNSMSKLLKIEKVKKSYVPIQPKPDEHQSLVDMKYGRMRNVKNELLCDEGNSQEQEEELVRYFQNNDSIDSGIVPVSVNTSQYPTNMAFTRSQSCVESNSLVMPNWMGIEQRSQSSLDSLTKPQCGSVCQDTQMVEPIDSNTFVVDHTSGTNSCVPEKLSQLRLLLEKSIHDTAPIKRESIDSIIEIKNDFQTDIVKMEPTYFELQPKASASYSLPTVASSIKSDWTKNQAVPQSPNTRTKLFSFTPISPGPHTSTPASPFISPRETPVPRSRQNSSHSLRNERFIYPSVKVKENVSLIDNFLQDELQIQRPRSFSTTNFDRSKGSMKQLSHRGPVKNSPLQIGLKQVASNDSGYPSTESCLSTNTPFTNDPLSSEVSNFFNNNNTTVEEHEMLESSAFRSHSAPLRRNTRTKSWMGYVLNDFFTLVKPEDVTPVPSEYCDFANDSGDILADCQTSNVEQFDEADINEISVAMSSQNEQEMENLSAQLNQSLFDTPQFDDEFDDTQGLFKTELFDNKTDPVMTSFKSVLETNQMREETFLEEEIMPPPPPLSVNVYGRSNHISSFNCTRDFAGSIVDNKTFN